MAKAHSTKVYVEEARAKLNLRLVFEGRRADGYHLLSMLNSTISLADFLEVDFSAAKTSLVVAGERAVGISCTDNLVLKALALFEELLGEKISCRIHLRKSIPSGAGLGGGSSDAAAMLRILFRRYSDKLALTREQALAAAQRLGADVPYFLEGGLARVCGIGEIVQKLPSCPALPVLLCIPETPIVSSDFYTFIRKIDPVLPEQRDETMQSMRPTELEVFSKLRRNDFENYLEAFCPIVFQSMKEVRASTKYPTGLTGSGSVFFVLGDANTEFEQLYKQLNALGRQQRFNIIRSELSSSPSKIDFYLNPL